MTATRRPAGNGWYAKTCATSNISASVSTRMTPDCRNSASIAATGTWLCGTVWPSGTPCVERPLFTATTGFAAAARRASRANLRGFPSDSR